jgi:hypothetical protein
VNAQFARAARKLFTGQPGETMTSKDIAGRAAAACVRLSEHLSRLIGDTGFRTLLKRSIVLASATYPLLATPGEASDSECSRLRDALEQQEPEAATDAFVAVLSTLVGILKRLIGEGLVERLLHEVWPAVFPSPVEETP